ncbi:2-haloalkanoic acid dehalogenase [Vibrio ishigakensis]|uniref:2-haloalkanoic acid dehalogenase n=1 Tax=Vibrio ishigakensis TaxID=1481914 RepID=A0A0B8NQW2_9VIBR|nr:5-amino-6-(5-phospho-D-ribitylamino)uracil phosphatase YigB [Vibrio ishigakensis]GAM56336.1 2-haloalkanoic acid dehalogenase [Vibrio ishigakensis]
MRFYRGLSPIKAMTFDLDDTLYDNHPVIRNLERELRSWLVTRFPELDRFEATDWMAFKRKAINSHPDLKHDVTKAREKQLSLVFQSIGVAEEEIAEAVSDTMHQVYLLRNEFEVPESSIETLKQLSKIIPLVAITNGNVDLEKIGIAKYFQLVLKAGPNGKAKPSKDLFQKASDFLDLDPEHILHVGDHLISDVSGAKRAGFQAAWFNDKPRTLTTADKPSVLPDVEISYIPHLLKLI